METSIDFLKPCFVIITGASKGIGRQIAIDTSKKLCDGSEIVLVARSEEGLKETQSLITSVTQKNIKIETIKVDFSNFTLLDCEKFFNNLTTNTQFESGVIFHNVGSIGTLKKVTNLEDLDEWKKHYDLNLFSTILFNNHFIKTIGPITKRIYVINITSLCGRKPFNNLAMYGSAKAARDLYFKVLDVEEPNITVLNYSPGPVKTDMVDIIVNEAEDEGLRQQFKTNIMEKTILTPPQTVSKLIYLLERGKFNSGDTVDYYDV
ncbi:sepiapterin reductase [Onthophagus taurus]|uniref:sepiapterin reductase n=1 Tax=Onthophagus taurus TaxID=166361 RepID=UPI000C204E01|nr:sepiapterin reductase [Onthophagus taurus]